MSAIIQQLDTLFRTHRAEVEDWLHQKRKEHAPFFYTSVDLRHSGMKLAPVDTNLYPAGFNNLSVAARHRAVHLIKERLDAMQPSPRRILIIPENHTRNLFYLENLFVLSALISAADREVQIGSLNATEPMMLTTQSGKMITQMPLVHSGNILTTSDGFRPDMIVLNNDCTSGVPQLLEYLDQPIDPPYQMGWYNRRKSEHFRAYEEMARGFATAFSFDPWLIMGNYHRCGIVDFREGDGVQCIALGVEKVLHQTREKYKEYGIKEEPYVFIKADSGTYGMGIMTARSAEEAIELNKKARNKMDIIKEGTQNTEVIIQEGIPTIDKVEGSSAEPMMYLVDGVPVGGAYRVNTERDAHSNLNAPGMRFAGMCDEGECGDDAKDRVKVPDCNFCVFGLISTLAALAARREVYDGLEIGFSI